MRGERSVMTLENITAKPFTDDDAVRAVLTAFWVGTLPRSAWNHRAHLTVALALSRTVPPANLLDATRREILRFNDAIGIVSTPEQGYHETLTAFYTHVVLLHAAQHPTPASVCADANALYERWGDRELPLRYYSRAVLFSPDARARWTPPDLLSLPTG
jgi:hypothetical protein